MGSWGMLLAAGLTLVLFGLFTHWSISVAGAILPFLPLLSELLRRRRGPPP